MGCWGLTMTKPTGRPRGRLLREKAAEKSTKRKRGRPRISLALNPERYFLAIVQAHIDIAKRHGISERRVVDTYAGLRYGRPVQSRVNLESLARGERFQVQFEVEQYPLKGSLEADGAQGRGWLNRNAFRPYADNPPTFPAASFAAR
jgi:hypothetical protein